jgi:DNA-binding NtrC family response regulator
MGGPKRKVLIVDDDASIRTLLSIIVADHAEFTVSQAEDGRSALNQIELDPPDILLTDVQMPGMSGLDLIAVVRARHPQMKMIAMSGTYSVDQTPLDADAFYMKNGRNWAELISILESIVPVAAVALSK